MDIETDEEFIEAFDAIGSERLIKYTLLFNRWPGLVNASSYCSAIYFTHYFCPSCRLCNYMYLMGKNQND